MKMAAITIDSLDLSFSIVTDHIFFPLDLRDVRPVLARNGFELSHLTSPLPVRPIRVGGGGMIARKENFSVNMDFDRNIVGLSGKSSERIIEVFDELTKILKDEMRVDLASRARYYEMVSHYHVITNRKPSERFSRICEGMEIFEKIEKIMGFPVSSFGLRISPKGSDPDEVEWFDVAVEPDTPQPNKYYCGIVFRSKEKEKVTQQILRDREFVRQLIEVIESE